MYDIFKNNLFSEILTENINRFDRIRRQKLAFRLIENDKLD